MVNVLDSILDSARRFLLAAQDEDGFWRDYVLPPGMSTAWTTACVGRMLADYPAAVERARTALLSERRTTGWGYNMLVSTDADSTAWTLRFMAKIGDGAIDRATELLKPFISNNGAVRTFRNTNHFGTWAGEHADVTSLAGLALTECSGDEALTIRIRNWILENQRKDGAWTSFWWATDAYATAKSLEFLNASGGIPNATLSSALAWLAARPLPASSFEAANLVMGLRYCGVGQAPETREVIDFVIETRNTDGSWPASKVLLVPHQQSNLSEIPRFADARRLMSTVTVLEALTLWQSMCKTH